MKRIREIDDALEILSSASGRWDYEEKRGPLWEAAQQYPGELIEYFDNYPEHQFSIAWCLAHVRSNQTKEFFLKHARDKDQYIRWCAYVSLGHYRTKEMIDLFVKGLRDRSSLVKGEALKAVRGMNDERIAAALKHLLTLKSFKKNSPGYFKDVQTLLNEMDEI